MVTTLILIGQILVCVLLIIKNPVLLIPFLCCVDRDVVGGYIPMLNGKGEALQLCLLLIKKPSAIAISCYIALFNPTVNQVISYIILYNLVIYIKVNIVNLAISIPHH